MSMFLEIILIIIFATFISGILRLLGQPMIIGYIITGILVSPHFLGLTESHEVIEIFAEMGVAFLLFLVGMHLNPKLIKEVGGVAIATGVGQVAITSSIGFIIALLLGFGTTEAIYIAIGLAFSSTIIITKLLSDKGALDTLYGKVSIGFLIVQDFIVVLALIFIDSLNVEGTSLGLELLTSIGLMLTLILLVLAFSYYFLPKIIHPVAKSQEFLLLFAISWCFLFAGMFYYLDFSIEVGALLAGIALSTTSFRHEVSSKMRPLRDFFLMLFFIMMGSQMVFENFASYILPMIIFSLLVLIGNPLIVLPLMGLMGYTKRTGFHAGFSVAQISEFSLIVVGLGVTSGHISNEILSLTTLVALITIVASTYLITYSSQLYRIFEPYLGIFERKGGAAELARNHVQNDEVFEVIVIGYGRESYDILDKLEKMKKKYLIVDHDPDVISSLTKKGYNARYGDAGNLDFINSLPISDSQLVISTVHDLEVNNLLLSTINNITQRTIFIAVSDKIDEAFELYEKGADYILLPHYIGGYQVSALIESHLPNPDKFFEEKIKHLKYLKKRVKNKKESDSSRFNKN